MNLNITGSFFYTGRYLALLTWLMGLLLVLNGQNGLAQTSPKKEKKTKKNKKEVTSTKPTAKDSTKKPQKVTIADKVKSCKKYPGLFTLYQDTTNGNAFILVKKDQLDKQFIYYAYVENGSVFSGHFRGQFRAGSVFRLQRYFDRIEWQKENHNFYFDPKNALSKASDANITRAPLVTQKITVEDSVKGEMLLEANPFFLTEALLQIKNTGDVVLGGLNAQKTKYLKLRSYPKNTDVYVEYAYDQPMPTAWAGADITDNRAVTVKLLHSILEAPDDDYKPRFDDPRVGYFTVNQEDLTTASHTPFRDKICRWHLVKKDPTAAVSEPVEPIVFWIENTTPLDLRETIRNATLRWNEAFEEAGFRNAIVVKEQPDTATWEAGDIRYNVLRWTSSPYPPFYGLGPSFADPRTGRILGADIMFEYAAITGAIRNRETFAMAGLGFTLPTDSLIKKEPHHLCPHNCNIGAMMQQTAFFGYHALEIQNFPAEELDRYVKEFLYFLVLHEVGHTLGLQHNMKASQLHKPNRIHDRALTEAIGLTGSVMDYPAANIALDPSKQGQYYPNRPGPYDKWAIKYGYTPAQDQDQAQWILKPILDRSTDSLLVFGNDADDMRFAGFGLDPRVNIFDMSGDQITYSDERMELCNRLFTKLRTKAVDNDKSYQKLLNNFYRISADYAYAGVIVSRFIGGQYIDRGMVGQPGAKPPFMPVSLAEQKRAMALLEKRIFAPDAFQIPAELYNYLAAQRRGYNFFLTTQDPKIHDRFLNIQRGIFNHILHPNVLKRLTDSRLYGNQYTLTMFLTDLTDAVFKADLTTAVNPMRQNLQQEYIKLLLNIAGLADRPSIYDNFTIAQVFGEVLKIEQILKANPGINQETASHRLYLLHRIKQGLESKRN